jgi:hypothetical protein
VLLQTKSTGLGDSSGIAGWGGERAFHAPHVSRFPLKWYYPAKASMGYMVAAP